MNSRVTVWLLATVVWGALDLLMGDSLKPLIGQSIFGALVLWMHSNVNKEVTE